MASRNLECHIGKTPANLVGIGLPFATAWLFFFGASLSALVSALTPILNGAVQFCVPALLFYFYLGLQLEDGAPTPPSSHELLQRLAEPRAGAKGGAGAGAGGAAREGIVSKTLRGIIGGGADVARRAWDPSAAATLLSCATIMLHLAPSASLPRIRAKRMPASHVNLSPFRWRLVGGFVAGGMGLLILATYVLQGDVASGRLHPRVQESWGDYGGGGRR